MAGKLRSPLSLEWPRIIRSVKVPQYLCHIHLFPYDLNSRGLFATHYHHLSGQHANDPRVAIMHMACAVGGASEEETDDAPMASGEGSGGLAGGMQVEEGSAVGEGVVREVTFLYKLAPGACPRSYGTNVARLAGLPERVVLRAAHMSRAKELRDVTAAAAGGEGGDSAPMQVDG